MQDLGVTLKTRFYFPDNLCYLQMVECEALTHDRVIGLAGHGPCNGVPLTYGCNTNTTCDVMQLQSVCGSDGVTYRNPCLLHQAACKLALTGKKMIKKHDGECSEIESDPNCPAFCENDLDPVCSKGNVTYSMAYGQTIPQCNKYCTAQYQPVCGSDHHTYSNLCKLQIAQCEAKYKHRVLYQVGTGPCHSTGGSGSHGQTYFDCRHQDICDDEQLDPVCGNDGVTYRNPCLLHEAACAKAKTGHKMMQAHSGECSVYELGLDCSQQRCGNDLNPVCSKGNSTFRNLCMLRQMYCRYASHGGSSVYAKLAERYTFDHNGTCDGTDPTQTTMMDCGQFALQGVAVEGGSFSCPHSDSSSYVCGADGHTYSSVCYLCRSMKMKNMLEPAFYGDVINRIRRINIKEVPNSYTVSKSRRQVKIVRIHMGTAATPEMNKTPK
ncbi:hypothetical protein FSP39_024158 [Pinctada imbricata]|uniref:Kazal-like domain-containing protein n=1 Tax=Pinctada imbricata TaxID=66713 RepID=A0AA88XUF1_PINIB|nr:hypothetical protein FSP39_024158 [Pinctada imbricata]